MEARVEKLEDKIDSLLASMQSLNSDIRSLLQKTNHLEELYDGKLKGIRSSLESKISLNQKEIEVVYKKVEDLERSKEEFVQVKQTLGYLKEEVKLIEASKTKVVWWLGSSVGGALLMALMGLILK